jgi:hypothetical protein
MSGDPEARKDTTIALDKRTKRQLKAAKKHPRETDNETVQRALQALAGSA